MRFSLDVAPSILLGIGLVFSCLALFLYLTDQPGVVFPLATGLSGLLAGLAMAYKPGPKP